MAADFVNHNASAPDVSCHLCVLSVIPGENDGSAMIFARRQVESLRALQVETHTFFLSSRTRLLPLCREVSRLRSDIKRLRPDIVHAHYGTVTALLCALVSSVPLVITYRGSDLNPTPKISLLRSLMGRLFSQLAALRAQRIICVSTHLKDRLWWRHDRVSIIPSGVDTNIFHPMSQAKCRQELGWGPEEKVVVFNAGKNPLLKRLDLAEEVVEAARETCGAIRFVIFDGSVEPDRVPVIMNAANCLLVTSENEGSPNIVKEALACNLPIVSVDVGDVAQRLKGVSYSYIAKRDVDDLSKLLINALNNPLRSNGSLSIVELSQEKIARDILYIYQACIP